jgi:hypothetical protein
MKDENIKKGKGLLSNLVGKPKKSSCCCGGYEIEEIPEEENTNNGSDNVNKASVSKK